jgi:transcriptional regulator with XRE-family HTH domain
MFGAKLKALREGLSLSELEFARKTGVDRRIVDQIESGDLPPPCKECFMAMMGAIGVGEDDPRHILLSDLIEDYEKSRDVAKEKQILEREFPMPDPKRPCYVGGPDDGALDEKRISEISEIIRAGNVVRAKKGMKRNYLVSEEV